MYTPASSTDAFKRLEDFATKAGKDYTQLRNYDFGPDNHRAVSKLSPYLARRVILPEEVLKAVLTANNEADVAKFCQEVFWQTYWRGWLEMRPQVWEDAQNFPTPTGKHYQQAMEGRTGIDAFDFWVNELKMYGYLHNHARMWFASIWIHTLQLPWKWGAMFFFDHLCDADCASNTLSWRWVAGLQTKGKAYLAQTDNIIKYTKGRFAPQGLGQKPMIPVETVETNITQILPQFPTLCTNRDGWIIFPDDFSVHRTINLTQQPVLVLNPQLAYPWRSSVVKQFNQDLVQDLTKQIPDLTIANYLNEVTAWAKEKKVHQVGLVKSPVGIYDALQQRVIQHLPDNIQVTMMRRDWDKKYLLKATKGFFHFKKEIGLP